MKKIRNFLSNFWFIHFLVILGLFTFIGYLSSDAKPLLFFVVLCFSGAICGAFIRVIDAINRKKL